MVDDAQTHTTSRRRRRPATLRDVHGLCVARRFRGRAQQRLLGTVERHYARLFEEAPTLAASRQSRLHRGRGRSRDAGDDRPAGLRRSARHRRHHPRLASRPLSRDPQPARARASDRAGAGAAQGIRRLGQSRRGLHPLRPVLARPAGGGAALLAVLQQPAARRAPRRDHGRGAAPRRRDCAPSRPARRRARGRAFSIRCRALPALVRDLARTLDRRAPLRGSVRPRAALGWRAQVPGRRAGPARTGSTARRRAAPCRHRRSRDRRAAAARRGGVRARATAGAAAARSSCSVSASSAAAR